MDTHAYIHELDGDPLNSVFFLGNFSTVVLEPMINLQPPCCFLSKPVSCLYLSPWFTLEFA